MLRETKGLNLTQQVTHHLGRAIVGGKYNEANPVPSEALICEELGVSRSAAREAVKSLAAKGLISSRARQGIRILPEGEWNLFDAEVLGWIRDSNPTIQLLREFSELRIAVEPEAAWLAAQRQNREEIEIIEEALRRMEQAEYGLDDPMEADIAFHISVLEASGNRFFKQLGRIIDTTLRLSIRFTNKITGVNAAAHLDHKRIYDAIEQQRPEDARREAESLVAAALKTINSAQDSPDRLL